jgi:hypothetical protein
LKQIVGTRERESYEAAIAGVWTDLRTTLHRLELLAADPDEAFVRDDAPERLGGLQYSLHRSAELVSGLEPPIEAEPAHEELAEALTDARDATAEIAYVLDVADAETAQPYVYEWRGALFRVRLAQVRLAGPAPAPTASPGRRVRSRQGTVLVWALAGIVLLVALALMALALGALAGTR